MRKLQFFLNGYTLSFGVEAFSFLERHRRLFLACVNPIKYQFFPEPSDLALSHFFLPL